MGKLREAGDDRLVQDGKGKLRSAHDLARATARSSREGGTRTGDNHRASSGAYHSGEDNTLEAYPTSFQDACQAAARKAYPPGNEPPGRLSVGTDVRKWP